MRDGHMTISPRRRTCDQALAKAAADRPAAVASTNDVGA
jgi:hypothetical protein